MKNEKKQLDKKKYVKIRAKLEANPPPNDKNSIFWEQIDFSITQHSTGSTAGVESYWG